MDKPRIRFKGYTEAWEQRKVSDVAEIITGGTPSTKVESYWKPKEIPWLSSGEVHKKYITFTDDMISKEGMNNSSAKMVKENSVLIALAGQGKTRGTVAINRISLTTNQSIAAMTFDEEIVPEFVFCNLENRYDEIRRMSSGDGSRGGLNKQLVGDIEIPYTTRTEQEKIGTYFSALDNLITLHQRKCDETKILKKYMLQNMFPQNGSNVPKIRFDGFTNAWEQRKLGEIAGNVIGGGTPKTSVAEYWDGSIPWIQSSNVQENRMFEFEIPKSITQLGLDKSAAKLIPQNSIAVVTHVGVGKLVFVPFSYATSQDFTSLAELKIDAKFTCYSLYQRIQNDLHIVQGSAIKGITKEDLLTKEIMVPEIEEQKRIGEYFRRLDRLITLHQRKCDELLKIKKFMLQNMFV